MRSRTFRQLTTWLALASILFVMGGVAAASDAYDPAAWDPQATKAPLVCNNGIVVAGHPLAAQAGLRILMAGGNAVDAAVATAAALSVTISDMIGPLGSGWAVVYTAEDGNVTVGNFDGEAPMAAEPEMFTREDLRRGILAPTIGGNLKGWEELIQRYGTLPFGDVLQPAIELADKGWPLDYETANFMNSYVSELIINETWAETYFAKGALWEPGDIFRNPNLARTLRRVAVEGTDLVYGGEIGEEIIEFMQENGGIWTLDDLKSYEVLWEEPIHTTYRGLDVYGAAPPSSTITWMQILNILENFDLPALGHNSADYVHIGLEATKRAYLDAYNYVADPRYVDVPTDMLLSKDHAAELADDIDMRRVLETPVYSAANWPYIGHSTTHMIVVDRDGNVVSMTNTLGAFYGSGIVLGDTGLLGSNGMDWFDMDIHPWTGKPSVGVVEGGKRNRFTLSPGIIMKEGRPYIVVGGAGAETTMYGIAQPIINVVDFGMNASQALEAPRYRWGDFYHYTGGTQVWLQRGITEDIRSDLAARGHDLVPLEMDPRATAGTTQLVVIHQDSGATEGWGAHGRGYVVGW